MLYMLIAIVLAVAIAIAVRAHAEGRLDLTGIFRRASTWLGLLTAAQGSAILAFNAAPPEFKAGLSPALAGYLLIGMMVCGALTGLATSIQQRWLSPSKQA